ncbi:hypothetical protein T484DRAFT_3648239, partial [Baffinella frigidus]
PKPPHTSQQRFDTATIREETHRHLKHLISATYPNPTTNTRNLEGLNLSKHLCHALGTTPPTEPFTNLRHNHPIDINTLHNKLLTPPDANQISLSALAAHFGIKILHLSGPLTGWDSDFQNNPIPEQYTNTYDNTGQLTGEIWNNNSPATSPPVNLLWTEKFPNTEPPTTIQDWHIGQYDSTNFIGWSHNPHLDNQDPFLGGGNGTPPPPTPPPESTPPPPISTSENPNPVHTNLSPIPPTQLDALYTQIFQPPEFFFPHWDLITNQLETLPWDHGPIILQFSNRIWSIHRNPTPKPEWNIYLHQSG